MCKMKLLLIIMSLSTAYAATASTSSTRNNCELQGNFYCASSDLCVSMSQRCNGYYNCYYGEDEAGCGSDTPITTTSTTVSQRGSCRLGNFYCEYSQQCISWWLRCDGYSHCNYNEDESGCGTNATSRPPTTTFSQRGSCLSQGNFYCEYSQQCIPWWRRCDGYSHCNYNEDESGCGSTTTTSALPTTTFSQRGSCLSQGNFYCEYSQQCIPRWRRCDGYSHCNYNEDESGCGATTTTSAPSPTTFSQRDSCISQGNFYCEYSRQCLVWWRRCDGYSNCNYNEDESGCGAMKATSRPPPCGGSFNRAGTIYSPNFPQPYPNDVHCAWSLFAKAGYTLLVQFQTFNTEYNSDFVRVYYENHSIFAYSGNVLPPKMVLGASANITFRSDNTTSYRGFYLTFDSVVLEFNHASTSKQAGKYLVVITVMLLGRLHFCQY